MSSTLEEPQQGALSHRPAQPDDAQQPSTSPGATPPDPVTREVVDLMANLVSLFHKEYEDAAAARSLTGAQAKLLALLRRAPLPMRQIAQTLSCEPSNITGIVDRLELRGFVTREADPQDRRVKLVAATAAGHAASEELRDSLNFAREPLAALGADERAVLRDLLRRILQGATEG